MDGTRREKNTTPRVICTDIVRYGVPIRAGLDKYATPPGACADIVRYAIVV